MLLTLLLNLISVGPPLLDKYEFALLKTLFSTINPNIDHEGFLCDGMAFNDLELTLWGVVWRSFVIIYGCNVVSVASCLA
jgi:hypothetical protein